MRKITIYLILGILLASLAIAGCSSSTPTGKATSTGGGGANAASCIDSDGYNLLTYGLVTSSLWPWQRFEDRCEISLGSLNTWIDEGFCQPDPNGVYPLGFPSWNGTSCPANYHCDRDAKACVPGAPTIITQCTPGSGSLMNNSGFYGKDVGVITLTPPDCANNTITVQGDLAVDGLAKPQGGNAYACIDQQGRLFRSDVPCPQATLGPSGGGKGGQALGPTGGAGTSNVGLSVFENVEAIVDNGEIKFGGTFANGATYTIDGVKTNKLYLTQAEWQSKIDDALNKIQENSYTGKDTVIEEPFQSIFFGYFEKVQMINDDDVLKFGGTFPNGIAHPVNGVAVTSLYLTRAEWQNQVGAGLMDLPSGSGQGGGQAMASSGGGCHGNSCSPWN